MLSLPSGATVHVVTGGPLEGPPVVCIHGWGIHSYLWRKNLPALMATGFRVHAIDLPGHGRSSLPAPGGMTLDALTAHGLTVLDALGVARAALVAQSMGGRIATEMARRAPERVSHLVLFGSVGFGDIPGPTPLAGLLPVPMRLPAGLRPAALVRPWMLQVAKTLAYGTRGTFTDEDVAAYWEASQRPGMIEALWQALAEFRWEALDDAALASVTVPTLVVFGTKDRTVRPRGAAERVARLPQGRLVWVQDAGHVACEEAADESNALILEGLR
jgi:pimeloyl-ACP methyl ester carboxylesterase